MKKPKLPRNVKIPENIISNIITEYLSDTYNFCVNDYDIQFKNGIITAINIEWDTTD